MACEDLFRQMGFTCKERGAGLYLIETPLSFPGGEPISLYLKQRNQTVVVSDNANTLVHMRSMGMDVGGDRKKWKSLRQIVSAFGMTLKDTGEVYADGLEKGLQGLVARYIAAMLAVGDMERERLGISEELAQFIEEVALHLRAWRPKDDLTHLPAVTGHSGRTHFFHFRQAGELIDCARPHGIRTGSILRKAADIQNTDSPPRIVVVMDDREDPERATTETDILSTLVNVLPFSRLSGNLSGVPPRDTPH